MHLIRTNGEGTDFEDIHQVCPHTSSAWYIDQNLNAPQCAFPRLFKSHRELQQLSPHSKVKFISTIRDPLSTLISQYEFRRARGQLAKDISILEFAKSKTWTKVGNTGSSTNIYEHTATFWKCKTAVNFMLIPYEDLIQDRSKWIKKIADYMDVSCSDHLAQKIFELTTRDAMLSCVHKFDESWVAQQRKITGRAHPNIVQVILDNAFHDIVIIILL